jgi:protein-tyrosine phosphatase
MTHSQITPGRSPQWRRYLSTQWQRAFGLNVSYLNELLFVGGQFRPEQWPKLYNLGIRAVLSLQEESEDQFLGEPPQQALRILVPDFHPPTIEQLHQAVAFIRMAHAEQLPVMIHCHAGVGRAPLTTAAFLITQGYTVEGALETIRAARPIIDLNEVQLARLHEWHQHYSSAFSP